MDPEELYFRRLDTLTARENFLEKESLDATAHHLEVRTGFFDKLALLAAGSLAVGISFMTAGYQRAPLQKEIQHYLWYLTLALGFILVSLLLCVIHNSMTSVAVTQFSCQLESLSKGAHAAKTLFETPVGASSTFTDWLNQEIQSHWEESELLKKRRAKLIVTTVKTGWYAVGFFIGGYVLGLGTVVSIIATTK